MVGVREMQRRVIAGVLLTDIAEQGLWLPARGIQQPFPLRAFVERSQQVVDGMVIATEDEEILVTVWRNPDDALFDGVNLGGVRELVITDRFVRDPSRDTKEPYHFGGEITAETPFTWRIRMKRKRVFQVGTTALAK